MVLNKQTFDTFYDRGGLPLIELELSWPEIDSKITAAERQTNALLELAEAALTRVHEITSQD